MLNTILLEIYGDARVHDLLSRLRPSELREDLLHHCLVYVSDVYSRRPEHIEGLYERRELFAWFQRCIKMELTGQNSRFFRVYRRSPCEFDGSTHDFPQDEREDYAEWRERADSEYGPGFWDRQVSLLEDRREKRLKLSRYGK